MGGHHIFWSKDQFLSWALPIFKKCTRAVRVMSCVCVSVCVRTFVTGMPFLSFSLASSQVFKRAWQGQLSETARRCDDYITRGHTYRTTWASVTDCIWAFVYALCLLARTFALLSLLHVNVCVWVSACIYFFPHLTCWARSCKVQGLAHIRCSDSTRRRVVS